MKRPLNALEESNFMMPVQLSEKERKRMMLMLRRNLRPLDLSAEQKRELYLVLEHYLQDLEAWRAELLRIKPRSERAMYLRRIEKALRLVHDEVHRRKDLLNDILPSDLSENLGGKMTFAALAAATGAGRLSSNLRLQIKASARRKESISIESIEAEFDYKRRAIGLQYAGPIFKSMIDDLYAPLKNWVERDKRSAGRKPMLLRNMLLERLVEASPRILGVRASSTAKGRFVDLCVVVLPIVRLPTEGVEKAVGAVLRKRQLR